MRAERLQRQPQAGLLLELTVRGGLVGLAGLDAAARQRPPVRIDRRVLVALLEQHPAALVDHTHQHHPSHAGTVTSVTRLFTQGPVPWPPK